MRSTNITIEEIKKILQDMFKQHQEAITIKQERMFRSHTNRKIRDLTISVKKLQI